MCLGIMKMLGRETDRWVMHEWCGSQKNALGRSFVVDHSTLAQHGRGVPVRL